MFTHCWDVYNSQFTAPDPAEMGRGKSRNLLICFTGVPFELFFPVKCVFHCQSRVCSLLRTFLSLRPDLLLLTDKLKTRR